MKIIMTKIIATKIYLCVDQLEINLVFNNAVGCANTCLWKAQRTKTITNLEKITNNMEVTFDANITKN